jgi:cytochrome c553
MRLLSWRRAERLRGYSAPCRAFADHIARQLYGFKTNRAKAFAEFMKGIADGLNDDDIIAAASYVASLNPS